MYLRGLIVFWSILLSAAFTSAVFADTRAANLSVDAAVDGRIAIDLNGELWVVPGSGGDARLVKQPLSAVRAPRWSPDGTRLVYSARLQSRQGIWTYDLENNAVENLSTADSFDLYPDWHPDGERVLLSSDTGQQGFDLYEVDVPTKLRWRLSNRPGDEVEGAWSADGRDLVYVHHHNDTWSLILRRHSLPEEVLVTSRSKITAPSWRPDGSLISYFAIDARRPTLMMVILSEPRLVRAYPNQERFVAAPVSWLDRHTMIYSASSQVRQRRFDAWDSRPIRYRARTANRPIVRASRERPTLAWPDMPQGELIIRAARLYDGLHTDYQRDKDILIKGGRITGIVEQQEHPGSIIIDLGDITVLPGIVDADARLPGNVTVSHGPDLLAKGVTTIVATHEDAERLNSLWAGKEIPGPRLLASNVWRSGPIPAPHADATATVTTSQATGIATGESLPTQIRMLEVAGLTPGQALRSMGVNAAGAILADPYIGRIANGAAADLVFVDGDPLTNIDDVLNVVAVVRNGRFYSVSGLFDRAKRAASVE